LQTDLTPAYGVFAEEAKALDSACRPETVNTDGWQPIQQAWQSLLPSAAVILCFLHAFLKVRSRVTQALAEPLAGVREKIWQAYHAKISTPLPQTLRKYQGQRCPSERSNSQRYAESSLENLLISASMNGLQPHQQNPL
jgi:hypothetical protein